MQKFMKFIALISLVVRCIAKELELLKHIFYYTTFKEKGILEINNGTQLLNYDNQSQNSLEIFFRKEYFVFEIFYNDTLYSQRISGSIDFKNLDDMRHERFGYNFINFQQYNYNGISKKYEDLFYYTYYFNESTIFLNGQNFELKIFFIKYEHDFYMNLTVQFENPYQHQIVDSLTLMLIYITLQALQCQCLLFFLKQINQKKLWELKKILIYPYCFLVGFNLVFFLEYFIQIGDINNKYEWFYIVPLGITTFATFFIQLVTQSQFSRVYYNIQEERQRIRFTIIATPIFSIYVNILVFVFFGSFSLILFSLDISIYYQMFVSILLIPQIIYNFKFKNIELNGIYYFKLMAVNIFQILYIRGCPNYHRNNLSNFEKILSCSITLVLFCLQVLIIQFQYQNGPKNLISGRQKSKSEQSLLNKLADDDICPICLGELKNALHKNNCIKTQCGHIFHQKCLELWCKVRELCPLCNAQIQLQIIEEIVVIVFA